ncbi:MAG TPA: ChaB family protein [Actinomycetota bacterium]|nr:ChaB family protein [Actinomycetota bacterium]
MPAKEELPSTIQRSSKKAQRTWSKAHDSAVETYGEGRRSHQTAFAALKHSFEKKGDRWVAKGDRGPSDPRARRSPAKGQRGGRTYGGVDVEGSTKEELYERAKELDVDGRSRMSKSELAEAVAGKQ